jgi:hypothetical protein
MIGKALFVEDGDDVSVLQEPRRDLVHTMRLVLEDRVVLGALYFSHFQSFWLASSGP